MSATITQEHEMECCICRKVRTRDGWIRRSGGSGVEVSHGYCPSCYRKALVDLERDVSVTRMRMKLFASA